MYKDENFDEKVGGLVCEVSGRYRIEELEARLIRVKIYKKIKLLKINKNIRNLVISIFYKFFNTI